MAADTLLEDGQNEYSEQSDCSSLDNEENDSDDTCKVRECLEEDCKIPQFFDVDFCSTRRGYQRGILVQPGLSDHFCEVFCDVYSDFTVPKYYLPNIQSIVRGDSAFHGNYLISNSDLVSLYAADCVSNEDKWLTNFVIDSYLQMVKSAAQNTTKCVEVFTWEEFAKIVGKKPASTIAQKKEKITQVDIILVPCNSPESKHWFLLAVFPKFRRIVTLDSMSSATVKPTAQHAIEKMATFLVELDSSIDIHKWEFYSSLPSDVPQQNNNFDCGVFVCSFARCLALGSKVLTQPSINAYRTYMVLELQEEMILPIPPPSVMCGRYYAVDYINKFYIGRVLDEANQLVKFKFLHRSGAFVFDWPKTDDIERVHTSCIFFGPIDLQGCGPFRVPQLAIIEKTFRHKN